MCKEGKRLVIGFEGGSNVSIFLIGASTGTSYIVFGGEDPRSGFYYWQTPEQLYGIGVGLSSGITLSWGKGEYVGIANIINTPLGSFSWSEDWKTISISPVKTWGITWGKIEYRRYQGGQ